jgi:hypothetical protein
LKVVRKKKKEEKGCCNGKGVVGYIDENFNDTPSEAFFFFFPTFPGLLKQSLRITGFKAIANQCIELAVSTPTAEDDCNFRAFLQYSLSLW